MEFHILYLLQNLHTPLVDRLMLFITAFGDHGLFWLTLGALLFAIPRTRLMGVCMLASIVIGFLLGNVVLKNLVARARPCWLDQTVRLLVRAPGDYSFPSGHTLVSFEGAVTVFLFNRKWGIPALLLAVLIGFSRMYLFVHFPTDVLAGAVLGTATAWLVAGSVLKYRKNWKLKDAAEDKPTE